MQRGLTLTLTLTLAQTLTLTLSLALALTPPQTIGGFDAVLSAIGRKPVTDALQLDRAGVKVDGHGLVEVDAFENTSAAGVFALGDCTTTGFELTPVRVRVRVRVS